MGVICKSGVKECTGCGNCIIETPEELFCHCDICGEAINYGYVYYKIQDLKICENCVDESKEEA